MNKAELNHRITQLPAEDKALLKLIFVDNIPKVTLMWLYRIRYRTLQNKLKKLFGELHA